MTAEGDLAPTLDPALQNRLEPLVVEALGLAPDTFSIALLRAGSTVGDGASIFEIKAGKARSVLLLSPGAFPDSIADQAGKARAMRRRLGADAGSVVLEAQAEGLLGERSYAIFPYHKPFSSGRFGWALQKRLLLPDILRWLQSVASLAEPPDRRSAETALAALGDLEALLSRNKLSHPAIAAGLGRIEGGLFSPRFAPMHGDFWKGNLLQAGGAHESYSFKVIDWGGSEVSGTPVFDLVRLGRSFGLSGHALQRQFTAHAAVLQCDPEDCPTYVAIALGRLARNLGEFPLERFLELSMASLNYCYEG